MTVFRPRTWAEARRALDAIRHLGRGWVFPPHRPEHADLTPTAPVEPPEPPGDGWPLEPLDQETTHG